MSNVTVVTVHAIVRADVTRLKIASGVFVSEDMKIVAWRTLPPIASNATSPSFEYVDSSSGSATSKGSLGMRPT